MECGFFIVGKDVDLWFNCGSFFILFIWKIECCEFDLGFLGNELDVRKGSCFFCRGNLFKILYMDCFKLFLILFGSGLL